MTQQAKVKAAKRLIKYCARCGKHVADCRCPFEVPRRNRVLGWLSFFCMILCAGIATWGSLQGPLGQGLAYVFYLFTGIYFGLWVMSFNAPSEDTDDHQQQP